MRARAVLSHLTTALVAIPTNSLETMVASLETRVLNMVPIPNPLIMGLPTLDRISAVVSPTNRPNHPLSPNNMLRLLTEAGYHAILANQTIPKPTKFQSNVNLQSHVVGLVKENFEAYAPKNANAPLVWKPPSSLGVVVIYQTESPSCSSTGEHMPMTHESSLSGGRRPSNKQRTSAGHRSFTRSVLASAHTTGCL